MSSPLPHGGSLLCCTGPLPIDVSNVETLEIDARVQADLELFSIGALSPLNGFMNESDYRSVLDSMRLKNGLIWPLPITLPTSVKPKGKQVLLLDAQQHLWGLVNVESVFEAHNDEAMKTYGTVDSAHPGVAYLKSLGAFRIAGSVTVFPLKKLPFQEIRLPPIEVREEIGKRKLKTVVAFQTRNPIHRAHEHLTKLALEVCDGLLIHPLVGETKSDDVPAAVRFKIYETLVHNYYPKDRTLLAAFPAAMRYAGPREALFHALVRKNYGATHFIVGRDHAGVANYYAPTAAQELVSSFSFEELGIHILKFGATFYCKKCESMASVKSCPHEATDRLELSGTKVREMLQTNQPIPHEFTRPEVAQILKSHFSSQALVGEVSPSPAVADATLRLPPLRGTPPQRPRGHIIWLTGLSGAGKSSLAQALKSQIKSSDILDGDEVRTFLSKGLGFSKADRDTNIARIGYVARKLARNGIVAIVAAISPYADARNEVKQLATQDEIDFIEIHVHAPLETLISRDTKGLYEKAMSGELLNFTGVNDPYEAPEHPELKLDTSITNLHECLMQLMQTIRQRGVAC
jgi:sulfate adenylyltransferase